jgi:hypothetical protein
MCSSKKVSALAAIAASSALALPGGATAAAGNSFDGHCVITGNAAYSTHGLAYTGEGTCHGSVDGGPSATYAAKNVVNEVGTVLSAGIGPSAPGVLNGTGSLTLLGTQLSTPAKIKFTIHQVGLCFVGEGIFGGLATGCGVPTNTAGTSLTVYLTTVGTQRS